MILQRAVGPVRDVFLREWGLVRRASTHERDRILRSRRLVAVGTLHKAVTALRDLFIETPSKALNSLGSQAAFEEVKRQTSARIRRLGAEWREHAELLGVTDRLNALLAATEEAVESFPYPALFSTQDIARVGGALLQESLRSTRPGVWATADAAFAAFSEELNRKISQLGERYADWWEEHTANMRRLANELHDALTESAVRTGRDESPVAT